MRSPNMTACLEPVHRSDRAGSGGAPATISPYWRGNVMLALQRRFARVKRLENVLHGERAHHANGGEGEDHG